MRQLHLIQAIVIIISSVMISFAAWCGYKVYELSAQHTALKSDYSQINDIYYGLLSVDVWEEQVMKIAQNQISDFEFTESQMNLFREQIDAILLTVINKANNMVQTNNKGWKGKLTKFAVNTFVDMSKLQSRIPDFTNAILATLTRPANISKLKAMAMGKLNDLASKTGGKDIQQQLDKVYTRYGVNSKDEFNREIKRKTEELRKKSYAYGRIMVLIVAIFLSAWLLIRKKRSLQYTFLVASATLALVVLLTGVTSPMLEIDARIAELQFMLLGEDVAFEEQMIFYQSKSILDVTWLLITSKPIDSIVVGILILAFSVILPILKIVSLIVFVLVKKVQYLKPINWLAFSSGKWSMADVMVVAIFMSYIAFDGIIQNQLSQIDRETEAIKALTTNNTALQAGFFLFVTYVCYSLILSTILKGIIQKK